VQGERSYGIEKKGCKKEEGSCMKGGSNPLKEAGIERDEEPLDGGGSGSYTGYRRGKATCEQQLGKELSFQHSGRLGGGADSPVLDEREPKPWKKRLGE